MSECFQGAFVDFPYLEMKKLLDLCQQKNLYKKFFRVFRYICSGIQSHMVTLYCDMYTEFSVCKCVAKNMRYKVYYSILLV